MAIPTATNFCLFTSCLLNTHCKTYTDALHQDPTRLVYLHYRTATTNVDIRSGSQRQGTRLGVW
jgi:hypothetical protein